MAQTHELQLKINAGAAKTGAVQFKNAIEGIKKSVSELDRDTSGAFTKLAKGTRIGIDAKPVQTTTTHIKSMEAALKQAQNTQLAAASAMRVSQSQADRLYEKLTRLGDTQGIAKLTIDLARLQSRLASAQTPLDVRSARSGFADTASEIMRTNRSLELQERATNIASAANREHAATLDQLRAKYSPVYAASAQYESALREITQAEKLGVLSARAASAEREKAAAVLAAASNMSAKYGSAMQAMGHQSQNAAYQLQDVFVTAEMGMSPMRIGIQQGMQLSMVMNDMAKAGGGLRGAFSGLAAGVMTMLNPISLATIGVIAGGAALYQWATSASDAKSKSDALKESQESLARAQTDLNNSLRESRMGVSSEELAAMDLLAAKTAEVAAQREKVSGMENSRRYADLIGPEQRRLAELEKQEGEMRAQLQTIRQLVSEKNRLVQNTADLSAAERKVGDAMAVTYRQAQENALAVELMKNGIDASTLAALDLSRVDMARGINAATEAAARLASQLGIAVSEALSLQNMRSGMVYSGRGGDPRKMNDQYTRELNYESPQVMIDRHNEALARAARTSRVGGGGGGGSSRKSALSDEAKELKRTTEAITERHAALMAEAKAMALVASNQFQTLEAAQMFVEAQQAGTKALDQKTLSMLAQIDAATALRDAQKDDPFAQVNESVRDGFKGAISGALQGDFDFSSIAEGIRSSIADALAQQITDYVFPNLSEAGASAQQAAQMQAALTAGGANAAAQIRAAMTGAAVQGGQQMATGVRTGALTGAGAMQRAGLTSGAVMSASVTTAGATGAAQMRGGIVSGSAQGANMFARATSGGGGIFGGGNWLGMALGLAGGLFGGGSSSSSPAPVYTPRTPVSTYVGPESTPSVPSVIHAPNPTRGMYAAPANAKANAGPVNFYATTNVSVEGGGDGDDSETAKKIATTVQTQLELMIESKLVEHSRYGGLLNLRGGS